jgi:aminoglycoside 6-adenylyltransferase
VDESATVIQHLTRWAEQQDAVRAMLLTSTRAIPHGKTDALSDYDVIIAVRDIHPFASDRAWIDAFGEVLVAYWDPLIVEAGSGIEKTGNVVQFADGLKIDFTVWPVEMLAWLGGLPELPAELDAGYRVLLDKERLTADLRPPTYGGYVPVIPDEATFQTLVNDFFVGAPYVAKCLLRDELLPAKWCLDYDMRYVYLVPMLDWWVACDSNWSLPAGGNGKGLKRRLPPGIWAELETTFAGANVEQNWEALFRMIALFRRVAQDVAGHLGYAYLDDLDRRVTEHTRWMQEEGPNLLRSNGT